MSLRGSSLPGIVFDDAWGCGATCKICEAPCRDGYIHHGKGCYRVDENGGGTEVCLEDSAAHDLAFFEKVVRES